MLLIYHTNIDLIFTPEWTNMLRGIRPVTTFVSSLFERRGDSPTISNSYPHIIIHIIYQILFLIINRPGQYNNISLLII